MAKVWATWFHGSKNDLKEAAGQARRNNPPDSELYVAALEAEWLVSNIDISTCLTDGDALHRRQGFRDAAERDDAHRLVNDTVTSLLDMNMAPKREGTIYFGGQGAGLYAAH